MPSRTARANERGGVALTVIGGAALAVGFVTALSGVGPVLQPWSLADAAAGCSVVSSGPRLAQGSRWGGRATGHRHTDVDCALGAARRGRGQLVVSGEGFAAGERVVLRFDTDEVARTLRTPMAARRCVVTVPDGYGAFAPAVFTVTATGLSSTRSSDAAFELVG